MKLLPSGSGGANNAASNAKNIIESPAFYRRDIVTCALACSVAGLIIGTLIVFVMPCMGWRMSFPLNFQLTVTFSINALIGSRCLRSNPATVKIVWLNNVKAASSPTNNTSKGRRRNEIHTINLINILALCAKGGQA